MLAPMTQLPTGTVTFLFTDIEGSTQRWDEFPDAMRAALERHDALMRTAVESNAGQVFKTVGDAFCAAVTTAGSGLTAAIDGQRAIATEGCALHDWGEHRLKDLRHNEHIFQLRGPGLPEIHTPSSTAEALQPRDRVVATALPPRRPLRRTDPLAPLPGTSGEGLTAHSREIRLRRGLDPITSPIRCM